MLLLDLFCSRRAFPHGWPDYSFCRAHILFASLLLRSEPAFNREDSVGHGRDWPTAGHFLFFQSSFILLSSRFMVFQTPPPSNENPRQVIIHKHLFSWWWVHVLSLSLATPSSGDYCFFIIFNDVGFGFGPEKVDAIS